MDPKLSGLDPKLREAYERVMNGPSSPQPAPTQTEQQPSSAQQSSPQSTIQTQTPPPTPNPTPIQTAGPPQAPTSSTISYNATSTNSNQGISAVKRGGGSKFSTVFILLGLIVLLVVYTFVWVYVFKLKVPFLPQF